MASLLIESAGPGATIQDGGRFGLLRYGVTPAGPMDWIAFATANLALGNPGDAAGIEIAAGGLSLTTDMPLVVAFAGGAFAWTREDRQLPSAARVLIRPGEKLRVRAGAWGAFAYCAVPGGLDVPKVLGSRATHMRSALGGRDGRGLHGGDRLRVNDPSRDLDDAEIAVPWLARDRSPVRVVLGPQDDHFTEAAIAAFLDSEFTLTGAADRMAYKFRGQELEHAKDFNIVSDGIALGAIQVAGDGQPMVLMADRQPTGGYTKIAHVCRADIGQVAQMRPGDTCSFRKVDMIEARLALAEAEDRLVTSADTFRPLRVTPSVRALTQTNLVSCTFDEGEDPRTAR